MDKASVSSPASGFSGARGDLAVNPSLSGESACKICGSANVTNFLSAPDRFHLRKEIFHLKCCRTCGCVWQVSPPQPHEMSAHYDDDYHRVIATGGETRAASHWQAQRDKQGGAILDIGCSSGGFLSTMKGSEWTLYGIEMEASTAERARQNSRAEVFVGDADKAPYKSGSFDVITCSDVLEHIYDPRRFLTKVLDWLKPDGIFFLVLPNIASWESRLFGGYWYGLELPRHTFHFSPLSLRCVMKIVGFEELTISTPNTTYVERSMGYLWAKFLGTAGFEAVPQSKAPPRGFIFRMVRKALRLTLFAPFGRIASIAGAGGSMVAVFKKGKQISE
jgi:SAM-dependent methyltransferase